MYYGHSFLVSNTYFGIFININNFFFLLHNIENSRTVTIENANIQIKNKSCHGMSYQKKL